MCYKIKRMNTSLPPLNAVRAFVAAARHQSFTLAANELHITHSAISHQVKALESYMGVRLFDRRIRQVSLTLEGLRFFTQADAALTQIANAAQSVMSQTPERVVRINVRPSFAVRWLIPRLPEFIAQYPGIEPHVLTTTLPPESAGDFDISIRRGLKGWSDAMQVSAFIEDDVCLVMSPAFQARYGVTDPGALAGLTLLRSKSRKGDWEAWLEHVGIDGVRPVGQMQFDHVHFVLQAVEDGLGFAIVPFSLISHDVALGRLCCPLPDMRLPVTRYYYGVSPNATPEARYFIAWLEKELARQASSGRVTG
jgi:LysR family glycine cleavage system transcriptional activator